MINSIKAVLRNVDQEIAGEIAAESIAEEVEARQEIVPNNAMSTDPERPPNSGDALSREESTLDTRKKQLEHAERKRKDLQDKFDELRAGADRMVEDLKLQIQASEAKIKVLETAAKPLPEPLKGKEKKPAG